MASRLHNVTIDAHDPAALAEFWRQVLDYRLALSEPDEVGIETADDACPALVFVPVPEEKTVKNRLLSVPVRSLPAVN